MPGGREPRWESTVGTEDREHPPEESEDRGRIRLAREARDRTLAMPKLILAALQVNIAGGRLPEPEGNGKRYLKIPLDALEIRSGTNEPRPNTGCSHGYAVADEARCGCMALEPSSRLDRSSSPPRPTPILR